ncbi:MAG TPA: hypothetical protein PLA94_12620, partial [Myxococcota bacterium]|nr:hypothetical protein [Myxococcota bacterium]
MHLVAAAAGEKVAFVWTEEGCVEDDPYRSYVRLFDSVHPEGLVIRDNQDLPHFGARVDLRVREAGSQVAVSWASDTLEEGGTWLVDGATGTVTTRFQGEGYVLGFPPEFSDDLVLLGAPGEGQGGSIYVFDAEATGFLSEVDAIAEHHARPGDSGFGKYMVSLGDVDGDGLSDVIVEAGTSSLLVSGPDLLEYNGVYSGMPFGTELMFTEKTATGLPDFDGDGLRDFAVGHRPSSRAPLGNITFHTALQADAVATLYDDRDGNHEIGAEFGALGDVNGNGLPEMVVTELDPFDPSHLFVVEAPFCGVMMLEEVGTPLELPETCCSGTSAVEGALVLAAYEPVAESYTYRL